MKLNFYCIGSSKCGTSSLHDILAQHPDVFLPVVKETKFLSLNYANGVDWYYDEYFDGYSSESAVGEIYPCLALDEAPRRLHESFGGDIKLVAILRNPVKRLVSHFEGQKRIGKITLPFNDAVKRNPFLIENSLYAKHIRRFLEIFPRKNLRIYIFEQDFLENRKRMFESICDFLEIDCFDFDLAMESNSAWEPKSKLLSKLIYQRPRVISNILNTLVGSKELKQRIRLYFTKMNAKPTTKASLPIGKQVELYQQYFAKDVQELERLLNRDLSCWYESYVVAANGRK